MAVWTTVGSDNVGCISIKFYYCVLLMEWEGGQGHPQTLCSDCTFLFKVANFTVSHHTYLLFFIYKYIFGSITLFVVYILLLLYLQTRVKSASIKPN